jgi:hypothetical protein
MGRREVSILIDRVYRLLISRLRLLAGLTDVANASSQTGGVPFAVRSVMTILPLQMIATPNGPHVIIDLPPSTPVPPAAVLNSAA